MQDKLLEAAACAPVAGAEAARALAEPAAASALRRNLVQGQRLLLQ